MAAKIHVVNVLAADGELEMETLSHRKLAVSRNADPVIIVWWLRGPGNVVFEDPAAPRKGFEWHGPDPGVFSKATRSADGTRLIIEDCNIVPNGAKDGWPYVLRARDPTDGTPYESRLKQTLVPRSKSRTTTTPAIINR